MSMISNIQQQKRSFSITTFLIICFGGLTLTAVLSVLILSFFISIKNTEKLLYEKSILINQLLSEQVEQHLKPLQTQTDFIVKILEATDVNDTIALRHILSSSLAAAPQLLGALFVKSNFEAIRVMQFEGEAFTELRNYSSDPFIKRIFHQNRKRGYAQWNRPFWSEENDDTFINYQSPVWQGDQIIGFLGTVVTVENLSKFLLDLNSYKDQTSFILYGSDKVLAHPLLIDSAFQRSVKKPLPKLNDLNDPILSQIWSDNRTRLVASQKVDVEDKESLIELVNNETVFIYKYLRQYGKTPIIVGSYFPVQSISEEIDNIYFMTILGIIILIFSIIIAIYLSKKISRPVKRLSEAANHLAAFKFDMVESLPSQSVLIEMNEASKAFNSMFSALRAFGKYVPRSLVQRLLRMSKIEQLRSETRYITIMFTDIASFTKTCENLSAEETAKFLNHHFSIVTECIESQGGTVDKYVGDMVMAFWGAPEEQEDQAIKACRAAEAILSALDHDNQKRIETGLQKITLRIGIHSGLAVVGNIGSDSRMNYTAVGDSVNLAEKLQELAKEIDSDNNCVMVSEETAAYLGDEFELELKGEYQLGGRGKKNKAFYMKSKINK